MKVKLPVLLRNYDTQDRPTPPSRFSAFIPDCTWSKGDPYEDGRDEAGRPVAGVEHLDQLRHEDPEGVGYPVSWNMSSMLYCLIFHAGIVTLLHVRFAQSLLVFVRVYYLSTCSVCAAICFKFRILCLYNVLMSVKRIKDFRISFNVCPKEYNCTYV